MSISPEEVPAGTFGTFRCHAAGTVGIDDVAALFSPWRCEVWTDDVIALIVLLPQVAAAVKIFDAG